MIQSPEPRRESGPSPAAHAQRAEALRLCRGRAFDTATMHMERALDCAPERTAWAHDLAVLYARQGHWTDVLRVVEPRLAALDTDGVLLYVVASVATGNAAAAIRATVDLPVVVAGMDAQLMCEIGAACQAAGDVMRAETFLLRAIAIMPTLARAHRSLAILYHDSNRGERALAHARTHAALRPDNAAAQMLLAVTSSAQCLVDLSREARQRAMRRGLPAGDMSVAIKLMLMDPEATADEVLTAARASFAGVESGPRPVRPRSRPSGRLKIGYLSGEFRSTPSFHFLHGFLSAHDRRSIEVFLYSSCDAPDAQTAAYRQRVEHWRDVGALPDESLLEVLGRDRPDVLIDMSGHFAFNRLSVFARRAAPAQATFPSYPCTTGCPEMDFFLTDKWCSPDGSENEYSESLYRLDSGCLVYTPPCSPPLTAPPALRQRGVVFGLFQQNAKLTPEMWDQFSAVLQRTPGSSLLIHNGDAELDRSQQTRDLMRAQMAIRDVDPQRLRFVGPRPLYEHIALLGAVDIALDTWPYNGQTTTCECLWMGIPVVTRKGSRHAGRVAASVLARMEVHELVTTSAVEYVETAISLAHDLDRVVSYRQTLRNRMQECGLTNARRLARELEAAYRLWSEERGPA